MRYSLFNLIEDLERIDQTLPLVLTQSEHPIYFIHKYEDQVYIETKDSGDKNKQTVGNFLFIAKLFVQTENKMRPDQPRRIYILRIIDEKPVQFTVCGLKIICGYVYLDLDNNNL